MAEELNDLTTTIFPNLWQWLLLWGHSVDEGCSPLRRAPCWPPSCPSYRTCCRGSSSPHPRWRAKTKKKKKISDFRKGHYSQGKHLPRLYSVTIWLCSRNSSRSLCHRPALCPWRLDSTRWLSCGTAPGRRCPIFAAWSSCRAARLFWFWNRCLRKTVERESKCSAEKPTQFEPNDVTAVLSITLELNKIKQFDIDITMIHYIRRIWSIHSNQMITRLCYVLRTCSSLVRKVQVQGVT